MGTCSLQSGDGKGSEGEEISTTLTMLAQRKVKSPTLHSPTTNRLQEHLYLTFTKGFRLNLLGDLTVDVIQVVKKTKELMVACYGVKEGHIVGTLCRVKN